MNPIQSSIRAIAVAWPVILFIVAPLGAPAEPLQGQHLFSRCAACHLQDGAGVPGSFPPLAQRLGLLMGVPQGRDYLVLVVQSGLMDVLQIDGSEYRGVMPSQGRGLGVEGVAAVLNFVLRELNAKTLPAGWRSFTAAEAAQITARYPSPSVAQLLQLRVDVFGSLGN